MKESLLVGDLVHQIKEHNKIIYYHNGNNKWNKLTKCR